MARRRKRGGDHGGHHVDERWLVTYADMITLLLAVFIVMYALSNIDLRKFAAFAQSMSAAFDTDIMQGTSATTVTSGYATTPDTGQMTSGAGVVLSDYSAVRASLADFAIANGIDDRVEISRSNEGIVIRIGGSLLFDSGRAVISEGSVALLEKVISLVKPLPNRVRVEGHSDDVPPDGFLFRDNWQLSIGRAKAVLDAMVAGGIDPARLSVEGLAEYQPLVPNDSEAHRARNRRVDLVILYPDANASAAGSDTSPDTTE